MNAYVMPGLKIGHKPRTIRHTTSTEIIDSVCNYFKISKLELKKRSREIRIVYPRQICIYLLYYNGRMRLEEIVTLLSPAYKEHSTIIYARDKIVSSLSQKLSKGQINQTQIDLNNIENLINNN